MALEVLSAEKLRSNYAKVQKYGYKGDYETWLNERFTAKTNLFWLAKEVLGYELVDNYYCPIHPLRQSEEPSKCSICGRDLEAYPGGYGISPHREMCSFFVKKNPNESIANQSPIKDRLIMCPRGSFKALDLETLLPTPNGFVKLGSIKVGDSLFDKDGNITKVLALSPIYKKNKCYELTFSTGERVIADAGHLWITESRKDRDNRKRQHLSSYEVVRTTEEIAASVYCRKEHNHRVRVAGAVQLPKKNFSIAPYVLGYWLGDGTASNSNLTISEEEVAQEIQKEGEPLTKAPYAPYLWVTNGGKNHPWYRKHNKSLAGRLRKKNLINNKHIPSEYLRGSFEQRLALLQGLMDADGTCTKRGSCVFSNTNYLLVAQVRELAASLGLKPSKIGQYDAKLNGESCGKFYVFSFTAYRNEVEPFRLARKLNRLPCRKSVSLQNFRHIVSVREVPSRPVRCIMVDSPSHTYLIGEGFIPTHNSSIDEADCVQWIICFPDIRIALLTATEDLGHSFVAKVKSFFLVDVNEEGQPLRGLTRFQQLFPEHMIASNDVRRKGPADRFLTPARQRFNKEPSLWALSLKAATSGLHFEVGKYDDCVSNSNSGPGTSQEQRDTIRQAIELARSLIDPNGYHDNIGTPYNEQDAYAYQRANAEPGSLLVMVRPAWKIKKSALKKDESELTENDYQLFFPWYVRKSPNLEGEIVPWQTYSFLRNKKHKDPKIFSCQYLCDPSEARTVNFTEEMIREHITQESGLPLVYRVFAAWDLAYSDEKGRDYTVGVVGWIDDQNRLFIVDIVRQRFSKHGAAIEIAKLAAKWRVEKILIEDSPGAQFLDGNIRRALIAQAYSECLVEYFPVDNSKGAKNVRAELLETLLTEDRLWFSGQIGIMGQVIEEFTKFKPTAKRKDDIIDAIAHVARQIPNTVIIPKTEEERRIETDRLLAEKQFRELIYSAPPDPEPTVMEPPRPTQWDGMPVFNNPEEQIYGT